MPANYVHQKNRNYKNIMFWSGKYGTSAANVSISSESWGDDGGGEASVYVGVDGTNNGHSMLRTDEKYMHKNQGRWQEVAFYLKLSSKDGEYGVFRIFRDGNYLTGTDHDDILGSNPEKLIKYSHRGNFIDRGYLLGWVNGGYSEDTYFCIDDFSIRLKK